MAPGPPGGRLFSDRLKLFCTGPTGFCSVFPELILSDFIIAYTLGK